MMLPSSVPELCNAAAKEDIEIFFEKGSVVLAADSAMWDMGEGYDYCANSMVLGLPFWADYYVAFNVVDDEVSFVPV